MSMGLLKIAVGLLLVVAVAVAVLLVRQMRRPAKAVKVGVAAVAAPKQPAPDPATGAEKVVHLRRAGLVARTPDQLAQAKLADRLLQFPPGSDGYYPAVEAWLEQMFESLLDRQVTLKDYKALLELQLDLASDHLRQLREGVGSKAGSDDAAVAPMVDDAGNAVAAIRWCQDWAERQVSEPGALQAAAV